MQRIPPNSEFFLHQLCVHSFILLCQTTDIFGLNNKTSASGSQSFWNQLKKFSFQQLPIIAKHFWKQTQEPIGLQNHNTEVLMVQESNINTRFKIPSDYKMVPVVYKPCNCKRNRTVIKTTIFKAHQSLTVSNFKDWPEHRGMLKMQTIVKLISNLVEGAGKRVAKIRNQRHFNKVWIS